MNIDLPVTDEIKVTAYKLRHKPSDLYYRPGNGYQRKPNLSKKGKLYQTKPSFSWVRKWTDLDGKVKDGDPNDWEIVTISG